MYGGQVMEEGDTEALFARPTHPYTLGLLSAVPRIDRVDDALLTIAGEPPDMSRLPPGCPFAPRCPMVTDACRTEEPPLAPTDQPGHRAACIHSARIAQEHLDYADIFPVPVIPTSSLERMPRDQRDTVLELSGMKRHYPLMKGSFSCAIRAE